MSDNTPQPQADDNILSVGLRKLADTIVHFVYPYGNEATFYGYNPDAPVTDADGNEISYTIPTSNAINELKSTSIGSIELDAENNQLVVKDLNGDLLNNVPLNQAGIKLEAVEDDELNTITISLKGYNDELLSTVTIPKGSSEGGGGGDPNAFTDVDIDSDSNLNFYNKDGVLVDSVNIPVPVGPSKPIGRYPLPAKFGINDAYDYDPNGNYDTATGFNDTEMRNVTVYVSCSHSNIINDTYSDVEDIQYQLSIDRVIAEVRINWVYVTRDVTSAIMTGGLTLTNLVNGARSFSLANNDVIHFSLAEVLGTPNDSSQLIFDFKWTGSLGTNTTKVNLPISSESAGSTSLIITPITNNIRYNNLTKVLEYKKNAGTYVYDAQVLVAGNVIKTMYKIKVSASSSLEYTYSDTRDISTSKIRSTFTIQYPNQAYTITYRLNGLADQVIILQGVDADAW